MNPSATQKFWGEGGLRVGGRSAGLRTSELNP